MSYRTNRRVVECGSTTVETWEQPDFFGYEVRTALGSESRLFSSEQERQGKLAQSLHATTQMLEIVLAANPGDTKSLEVCADLCFLKGVLARLCGSESVASEGRYEC